jgi:hypothetical protein
MLPPGPSPKISEIHHRLRGAGFFSLRIPEFESADPGRMNSAVVMCAHLRARQRLPKSLPQLHIHHAAVQT